MSLDFVDEHDPAWRKAFRAYNAFTERKAWEECIIDTLKPDISGLVDGLMNAERDLTELKIAQANKTAPQNITESMRLSFYDALTAEDTALRRLATEKARQIGRPLLQSIHPDRNPEADPNKWNLARDAVKSGDVVLLHLLARTEKKSTESAEEVQRLIAGAELKYMGSRLHKIASLMVTSTREEALTELSAMIVERTNEIRCLCTPMPEVEVPEGRVFSGAEDETQ